MKYAPEIKKSPPHLLKKFAVCDTPLYNICNYIVSRDQCKDLGCCFYKGVCYETAVPIYVHVFSALIVVITVAFIITIIYRFVKGSRREKEIPMEVMSSSKTSNGAGVVPSSQRASRTTNVASNKSSGSQQNVMLTITEAEETEE